MTGGNRAESRLGRHQRLRLRSDCELLAVTAHDADAFGELYVRHVEGIVGYVARRVGEPEAAAEITAETFAQALEHRDGYDAARGPVRAWIFGIARNQVRAHWRHRRVSEAARHRLANSSRADTSSLDALERVLDRHRATGLLDAVEQLPERQRRAVRLRVLDGADYPTIADDLGVTNANARVLVHRGLRSLYVLAA